MNNNDRKYLNQALELCKTSVENSEPPFMIIGRIESILENCLSDNWNKKSEFYGSIS